MRMVLGSHGDGDGDGRGRDKRRRVDEQGCGFEGTAAAKGAEAIPAVSFSALPVDLRHRILMLLPIKDAIRTTALDKGWRDLWKSRWHPTSSRDIHLLPRDTPNKVLDELEGGPRLRLDRLSLVIEDGKFRPKHLKRFLAYAAECRVEDLHVDLRRGRLGSNHFFHFALTSPHLVHLSLRGIGISNMYYKRARTFYALEVIHLHSLRICELTFRKMIALCPRLHTLDVRRCDFKGLPHGAQALVPPAGKNLRSITVAECEGEVRLGAAVMPSLLSFRYSGDYEASPFFLPRNAALAYLYICCGDPTISRHFALFPKCFDEGLPDDLSCLNVLTICSNSLKVVSTWLNNGATAQWTSLCNLQSLRELQLLILGMDTNNLANIYVFLKASNCHSLERLFVQLPAISDVPMDNLFEVGEEPPEDGLRSLRMVKVMNFNWRRFEVQLVSFLLRKAKSLHKLQVVSPNGALLNVPGVPEADLLIIKDALDNGRMMLSGSDDAAIKPFHSEVFIDV